MDANETAEGRRYVALIPYDCREPGSGLGEASAEGAWAAVSALWHPALLAETSQLPGIESVELPSSPAAGEVRLIAAMAGHDLPSGYRAQAADVGAFLIDGETDRRATLERLFQSIPGVASPREIDDPVVDDFLALGSARWWLRDLTIAMGHVDGLDLESLTREVLVGARAWRDGDSAGAVNRLRAAFELLTQARERFYPVDAYFLDVCLLDPNAPAGVLADTLGSRTPVTILAPARAIEGLERRDAERLAELRAAIGEGWLDVIGGAYGEADESLRPLESVYWQFRQGARTYRRFLEDRNVETIARRRFGLYPQLPQIAKRFGFRFAIHVGLDAGAFPVPPESKKLWESPDGSHLESLTRPPIAADRSEEGLRLPWRIARTMKDDHVATLWAAHWPGAMAGWFRDMRRVAAYSPVFLRWVMASDYFHLTDRPFEMFRPEADDYRTPYLNQAAATGDSHPISRRVRHARLRARYDALVSMRALGRLLDPGTGPVGETVELHPVPPDAIEDAVESGRFDEAESAVESEEAAAAARLAEIVGRTADQPVPGTLVFNPIGVARRAVVRLPDDQRCRVPGGPLLGVQDTDDGVWGVVELPAFGYAWFPRDGAGDLEPAPRSTTGVDGRRIRNDSIRIEIDAATGGLRSIRSPAEETARLGQQLVIDGFGDGARTRMLGESFTVDHAGPSLAQARSGGVILHPSEDRPLARFEQRFRLWAGRPILEIDIRITELDAAVESRLAAGDPWVHHLACRWAWPDAQSDLRRLNFLSPERTTADRPETPDAIDISTRSRRTALLFGGLAHHKRHGARMLDTILIAGREASREFRLGVALDLEHPFHAVQEFQAPAYAVSTESGRPRTGGGGWFVQAENRAVAVTRLSPIPVGESAETAALAIHLAETADRSARCRLRFARHPISARQIDFQGEPVIELYPDEDTVLVDLIPRELTPLVVEFPTGQAPAE